MSVQSTAMQSTAQALTSAIAVSYWQGDDAAAFRSEWNGTHVRVLRRVSDVLETLSKSIKQQAEQQRAASQPGGGGGAHWAPSGGTWVPSGGTWLPHPVPIPDQEPERLPEWIPENRLPLPLPDGGRWDLPQDDPGR